VRYVLIGVGGVVLAVAVGLLVALVLRSLAAVPDRPVVATPTTPPSSATPVPGAPAPAPEARPEAGRNECVDALGDGDVDLDSVQLEMHDGDLVAQFRFASALPADEIGLGLNVERNGDKAYLLGVSLREGDVDDVFVQDFDRSDIDDLDTDNATVDGTVVTVVFPKDSIKRIGNDWSWSAFANVPQGAIDTCPEQPELQKFER